MPRKCSPLVLFAMLVPSMAAQAVPMPTSAPRPTAPVHQAPTQPVAVAMPRARAEAAAAQIDRLLAAGLKKRGEQPTDLVDDQTFVRRAYLQVVGRIPDLDETGQFLADQGSDKRAALVDRLLDSPGYTSSESDFWFDLLRVKSRQRQVSGEPFAHWIREAVRQGTPYDEFVRTMLTATGPAHQEGNGATGYLLRDANMPHDAMANTLRLFLGTRVECAQCHNHPFDKWTQREFYAMSAFFGGLRYRVDLDREVQQQLRETLSNADDRQKRAARQVLQSFATGLAGSGSGQDRLPQDYKYDDARPNDVVRAATLFGAAARLPKPQTSPARTAPRARNQPQRAAPAADVDSRSVFANWLTDPKNPRFARVITNRVWQRLFGRGLIEPVDDLKDDTAAVHPELQNHLEKLLVDLHFDLRQFERVLLMTRLFQQQVLATDARDDQSYAFRAPLLRRMTAEQTWDSLLTLVFADIDQRLRPTDARAREAYDRHAELSGGPEQFAAALQRQGLRYTDPQKFREQERTRLASMQAAQPRTPEQQQQLRQLQRDLAAARRRGDSAAMDRIFEELSALGVPRPGERAARGREGELLRASDLVQPAPANHLLRQFGQSDRETIEAATLAASVPQALTLLNGPIASGESSLRHLLGQAKTPAEKVGTAFLSVLTRSPTADEAATWCAELQRDANQGVQDLIWVLVNSNEFRFRR